MYVTCVRFSCDSFNQMLGELFVSSHDDPLYTNLSDTQQI